MCPPVCVLYSHRVLPRHRLRRAASRSPFLPAPSSSHHQYRLSYLLDYIALVQDARCSASSDCPRSTAACAHPGAHPVDRRRPPSPPVASLQLCPPPSLVARCVPAAQGRQEDVRRCPALVRESPPVNLSHLAMALVAPSEDRSPSADVVHLQPWHLRHDAPPSNLLLALLPLRFFS